MNLETKSFSKTLFINPLKILSRVHKNSFLLMMSFMQSRSNKVSPDLHSSGIKTKTFMIITTLQFYCTTFCESYNHFVNMKFHSSPFEKKRQEDIFNCHRSNIQRNKYFIIDFFADEGLKIFIYASHIV